MKHKTLDECEAEATERQKRVDSVEEREEGETPDIRKCSHLQKTKTKELRRSSRQRNDSILHPWPRERDQ